LSGIGYAVQTTTHRIGDDDYRIHSLRDRQQYWDPEGDAARAGISSAAWPLFGLIWPAGLALADEMSRFAVAGKRILEVGCGLGMSSLVLQRRGANITATDHHPLAEEFLRTNAALNDLEPINFRRASWSDIDDDLGRFDLIVGSDVLYERGHPEELAAFVARHAAPAGEVIVADPGRVLCGPFSREMRDEGYDHRERLREFPAAGAPAKSGRIMTFVR
jgi:2-polyprenyl-3-methyl-5-hydroxy-6-metoxy-1,4-benzoquinol methylase